MWQSRNDIYEKLLKKTAIKAAQPTPGRIYKNRTEAVNADKANERMYAKQQNVFRKIK